MSYSGKFSLTEFKARYEQGGEDHIRNYYDGAPLLVVLPDNSRSAAITWTPHDGYPTTQSVTPDRGIDSARVKIVPELPLSSIVVPITGSQCSVGRDHSNNIKLSDTSVSRKHAVFTLEDDQVFVRDLDSRGGTFIDELRLDPGRRYRVGPYRELRFAGVKCIFLDTVAAIEVCRFAYDERYEDEFVSGE